MPPQVSVVLPCFNSHEFLGQAIASVRAQTTKNLEIVVVNDGSTNADTVSYLASLPRDIRVVHQENRGLASARNTGFREARGQYVLPLDSDDWIEPLFIEKGLMVLGKCGQSAAFAFSYIALEGDQSGILRKRYNFFDQIFFNQLPYCILISKQLWAEVGGYDETMNSGYEDWEFNIRLGKVGAIGVVIDQPLFHYRVRKKGMLHSVSLRRHSQLWKFIQRKHRALYRFGSLVKHWIKWRRIPAARSPLIYFSYYFAHRCIPAFLLNWMFERGRFFSQSSRLQRGLNVPSKGHN